MPNTREKLIELLDEVQYQGNSSVFGVNYVFNGAIADHLIANGVVISNLETPTKWIPVSERLPKPYLDVITLRADLLTQKYHAVGIEYITLHGEANIPTWSKDYMTWKSKVTHWMPLPEPPKGE